MSAFDQLAESRIRAWLALPAAERNASQPALDPALPIEVQLMQDITALDRMAIAAQNPDEAEALRQKASDLTVRLMVLLEGQGRPLLAQQFSQRRLVQR